MNKYSLLFFSSWLILSGFLFMKEPQPLIQSEIVHKIINDKANLLSKRYKLNVMGDIVGMPNGVVKKIGISFQSVGSLTKEQGRKILLETAQELLLATNSNVQLRPYLKNYPFTCENVEVAIYVVDKKGYSVFDPDIEVFSIRNGILNYKTVDRNSDLYKSKTSETFDEALKICRDTSHS